MDSSSPKRQKIEQSSFIPDKVIRKLEEDDGNRDDERGSYAVEKLLEYFPNPWDEKQSNAEFGRGVVDFLRDPAVAEHFPLIYCDGHSADVIEPMCLPDYVESRSKYWICPCYPCQYAGRNIASLRRHLLYCIGRPSACRVDPDHRLEMDNFMNDVSPEFARLLEAKYGEAPFYVDEDDYAFEEEDIKAIEGGGLEEYDSQTRSAWEVFDYMRKVQGEREEK